MKRQPKLGTLNVKNSLIDPISNPHLMQQNAIKQPKPEKKGKRVAVIAGYGTKAAVESARKMEELLSLDNKRKGIDETNFETFTMAEEVPLGNGSGDIKPIVQKVAQNMNRLDDYDSMLVYICLRRTRWNPNLKPLVDLVTGSKSRSGKQKIEPKRLKNYLLILDLEYHVDLSTDPFHGLPEGVAVLTMNGEDKDAKSRNGKYTIFSGFLIEALKGGAADSYGMITLANLFSYLHEACMMEPTFHPTLKMLGSESLLLRRKDGILTKQQIMTFHEFFRQKIEREKYVNVRLKKELESNESMKLLLDKLIYLKLIAPCKFVQNEAKVMSGLRQISIPITCLSSPSLSAVPQKPLKSIGRRRRVMHILNKLWRAMKLWFIKHKSKEKKYDAYYLTLRGKHLLDMWDHFYFKFT